MTTNTNIISKLNSFGACIPARTWLEGNSNLSPQQLWETCPDVTWMTWLLGLGNVREVLSKDTRQAIRSWTLNCAKRTITVHAANALRRASTVHPDVEHRRILMEYSNALANIQDAASREAYAASREAYAASRAASDAASRAAYAAYAASHETYAAFDAASDAVFDTASDAASLASDAASDAVFDTASDAASLAARVERSLQANEFRALVKWADIEPALIQAGFTF